MWGNDALLLTASFFAVAEGKNVVNELKKVGRSEEPQRQPALAGFGIEWYWYVPQRRKSGVSLVLQDPLHGALVANSKLCIKGVKKMISNSNNRKDNMVQMTPRHSGIPV